MALSLTREQGRKTPTQVTLKCMAESIELITGRGVRVDHENMTVTFNFKNYVHGGATLLDVISVACFLQGSFQSLFNNEDTAVLHDLERAYARRKRFEWNSIIKYGEYPPEAPEVVNDLPRK